MNWLRTLLSGRPHFYIGGRDNPYMLRWYLIPRNRWLNIYMHKFCRDDDDRALHDHPWWFVSLVIRGGYRELTEKGWRLRFAPSFAYRKAEHRHRVELFGPAGERQPCWTIVVTGRKSRTWGFWCPKGFVPWHEFVAKDDHGNVGIGCGDDTNPPAYETLNAEELAEAKRTEERYARQKQVEEWQRDQELIEFEQRYIRPVSDD